MRPIVINGTVLCDPITGIPRYVYEVVTRLDELLTGTGLDVRLCYRDDGRPLHLPPLKNIQVVPLTICLCCPGMCASMMLSIWVWPVICSWAVPVPWCCTISGPWS